MANIRFIDLPPIVSLTGAEIVPMDQAGTTKQGTSAQIASLAAAYVTSLPTTVIQSGATYAAVILDVLIIVDKTIGSPTSIVLPLASTKVGFFYIKDGKGDASVNNITITTSGGDTIDGLASVTLSNNFGILQIAPNPLGGWVIINFG